jgi:hypothetical protein
MFIVLNRHTNDRDIQLFFGEIEKHDTVIKCDVDCLDFTDLAVDCGFFTSRGQARKNGWSGPVPRGFGSHKCGKKVVHWLNAEFDEL